MRSSFIARVSATSRCNLRCAHCDGPQSTQKDMKYEDMTEILEAAYDAGIRVVHWTGGEPTLRKDFVSLIGRARKLGFQYQKMTTNGLRLNELSESLSRNGLNRVNVSVPSIDREGYQRAVGRDALSLVLAGMRRAAELFDIVKMNVCLNRNNADTVFDYLEIARRLGDNVVVKFIELVPCGNRYESKAYLFERAFYSVEETLRAIATVHEVDPIDFGHHSRQKCRYYRIRETGVVFGLNPNKSIGYACQRATCRDLRFSPTGIMCDCSVNLANCCNLLEMSAGEKREAIGRLIELKKNRSSAEWASYSHTQKHYSFWRFGGPPGSSVQHTATGEEVL